MINTYILETKSLKVSFTNIGASLVNIFYKPLNRTITYGYSNLDDYIKNKDYLGCIIGPIINRITNAQIPINGKFYPLAKNYLGKHNLHYSETKSLRTTEFICLKQTKSKIVFATVIKHYLNDANIKLYIIYKLLNNKLLLKIKMFTDKPTYLNPTSHLSFNLVGKGNIKDHMLKLKASQFLLTDNYLLPFGIASVKDTIYDFMNTKSFSFNNEFHQIDNSFLVNKKYNQLELSSSDLMLTVSTNQKLIHLYTGNFYHDNMNLIDINSEQYGAIAIECSDILNYPVLKNYSMGLIKNKKITKIRWGITCKK